MQNLPPLTECIDKGAEGGQEFERLMHQILLCSADRLGFDYKPVGADSGDNGIDGYAPNGCFGLQGSVAFQFKWLWDAIHQGSKAQQIRDSVSRACAQLPSLPKPPVVKIRLPKPPSIKLEPKKETVIISLPTKPITKVTIGFSLPKKAQPKRETVKILLPPKPITKDTIRISLPPRLLPRSIPFRHYILVTPHDLTPSESSWLFETPAFSGKDVRDMGALVRNLLARSNQCLEYFWNSFPESLRPLLLIEQRTKLQEESILSAFVALLNSAMHDKAFYTPERFVDVQMSDEAYFALQEHSNYERLNRCLLESVFSNTLISRNQQICRVDVTGHHWGQARVEHLLRQYAPSLLLRYYPSEGTGIVSNLAASNFSTVENEYKRQVGLAHQNLRKIGLPPETLRERDASTEIRLREIFVPLRFSDESSVGTSTLASLIQQRKPVVILGDPGSGKSTLLAYLGLLFSGNAELPGVAIDRDVIPLHISLREVVRLQQDKPGIDFLDFLVIRARSDLNVQNASRPFFESKLLMGEAVVFFDGLDEVGRQSGRERIAKSIQAFHSKYSQCQIWVTSRIYGYTADIRLQADVFKHCRIDKLDDSQIDSFVTMWYRLQCPTNNRERVERTASLQRAIRRTKSVRRLAGNPLLLTLMAFIHQGLRTLPQDRGELYEKSIDMLLRYWQEAKFDEKMTQELHPFEQLGLHFQIQRDYLAHLALHIQECNQAKDNDDARGLITRNEALECLAKRHFQRSSRSRDELDYSQAKLEMEDFLDYISDRTGLLIDRGNSLLSFIHLSYQEYLSAWVYTCNPIDFHEQVRFFCRKIGVPAWDEVILLRLYIVLHGGGGPVVFDAIVSGILRELESEDIESSWLTLTSALRDNLEFSVHDASVILTRAVAFHLEGGVDESSWRSVLDEVAHYSERAFKVLNRVLIEFWLNQPAERAVRVFYIYYYIFGKPLDLHDMNRRSDVDLIRGDLVATANDPRMTPFLSQGNSRSWASAFATFNGQLFSGFSLHLARSERHSGTSAEFAACGHLINRIVSEWASRSSFAKLFPNVSKMALGFAGAIQMRWPFYTLSIPCSAFRLLEFTDQPSTPVSKRPLLVPAVSRNQLLQWKEDLNASIWTAGIQGLLAQQCMPGYEKRISHLNSIDSVTREFARNTLIPMAAESQNAVSSALSRLTLNIPLLLEALMNNTKVELPIYKSNIRPHLERIEYSCFKEFFPSLGNCLGASILDRFEENIERNRAQLIILSKYEPSAKRILERLSTADFWKRRCLAHSELPTCLIRNEQSNAVLFAEDDLLSLPLVATELWEGAFVNLLLSFWRTIFTAFPEGIVPTAFRENWFRMNSVSTYVDHFSVFIFADSMIREGMTLSGARGAIWILHAALAALMTGLISKDANWNLLLSQRDNSDPLIELAFAIYNVCLFESTRKSREQFNLLITNRAPKQVELFRTLGLESIDTHSLRLRTD